MKLAAAVLLLALAVAIFVCFDSHRAAALTAPSSAQDRGGATEAALARLSRRIDDLQRELAASRSQQILQQAQPVARQAALTSKSRPEESQPDGAMDVEAQRAAAAERHHEYVTQVAQAFADEQLEMSWAARATSRLNATLDDDEALRGVARSVECRRQTCRVQIDDDGSGKLPDSVRTLVIGVIDVLPSMVAEHADQGNGRRQMVLYMTSQQHLPFESPK